MRYAWLIAVREFMENAKTKGFWIGLILFPVILLVSMKVPHFLEEKGTPTRWFVLEDRTGNLGDIIDEALERGYQRRVFEAAGKYVNKYSLPEYAAKQIADLDLESTPSSVLDAMTVMQSEEETRFDSFLGGGGVEAWIQMMADSGVLKEDRPEFEPPKVRFARVEHPDWLDPSFSNEQLSQLFKEKLANEVQVEDGSALFAAVLIPEDIMEPEATGLSALVAKKKGQIEFWSINQADFDLRNAIRGAVDEELRHQRYKEEGVDADLVSSIQSERVRLLTLDPSKESGNEEVSMADTIRQYAPIGFVYLLWIVLMSVTTMLLNNTVEEKSNRIVEVLLSSVTAGELMAGKLLGIAGVGFTILGVWIGSLLGILYWQAGPEAEIATKLLEVVTESGLIWVFVCYFLMAYLLYSGIFLAIGSVCSTLKDAQNFMGPVMVIMMVPLLTMAFIPKDPHGTLATILSWIPLYTPFVMMNRAAADPPMFDLI
ncbi:MAG: ABC transporter permease, partial [Planctomycetes bacterium]|nr:ABC transporter permease [Planctomycetota bacterium]